MNDDDIAQWPSRVVDAAMRMADLTAGFSPKERAMAVQMFNEFARHDNPAQEGENEERRCVSK